MSDLDPGGSGRAVGPAPEVIELARVEVGEEPYIVVQTTCAGCGQTVLWLVRGAENRHFDRVAFLPGRGPRGTVHACRPAEAATGPARQGRLLPEAGDGPYRSSAEFRPGRSRRG